jgi:serine/threonine-protein kinase
MRTVLTPDEWTVLQEIVNTAADLDYEHRDAYLLKACDGQPLLRSRVDSLLAAFSTGEATFIGSAIEQAASAALDKELPTAGARLGAYRIQGVIGRGGMGVVYEALRDDDQYRMRVAIKVVATGLLSRDVLQRFRNERQILANLDHPNIAHLLDGGATESGLPYVVMEFVDGLPIDEYCTRNQLTQRQRLTLFVNVARAIQYAHQKLVVHRDLKPGNILVTEHGIPKLLDFGIAKLLRLDDQVASQPKTVELGRMMTPEYASPEQIRDEPITTATDVYQLGVVLYQLLTGRLPFPVSGTGLLKLQQQICEREPLKPALGNDMDLVILKALEKEPASRYTSAAAFADDIESYLRGFPVQARPASWGYVTRRFVRRNRLGSFTAALFLLLIAGSVIGMAMLTKRARIEASTSNQIADFVVGLFDSNEPGNGRGDQITARELLDRGIPRIEGGLKDSPEVRARILNTMGGIYNRLGDYRNAAHLLSESIDLRKNVLRREDMDLAGTVSNLADNAADLGHMGEAENLFREALRIERKLFRGDNQDLASGISNLSSILGEEGKLAEAETLNVQALEMRRRVLGLNAPETLITANNLETVYMQEGKYSQAVTLARDVLTRRQAVEREFHPDLGFSWGNLANTLMALGQYDEAETAARKALQIRLKAYPAEHPQIQWGRTTLADVLCSAGKAAEAESLAQQALAQSLSAAAEGNSLTAYAQYVLGAVRLAEGKTPAARKLFEGALALREKSQPPGSHYIATNWLNLAETDMALDNLPTAVTEAERAAEMFHAALGPSNVFLANAKTVLAELHAAQGHWSITASLSQQALDTYRVALPPVHPATARAQSTLGWALWKLGKSDAAAEKLQSAYQMDRKVFHNLAATRQSARVAANWLDFLRAQGRTDEANRVASEAALPHPHTGY